MSPAALHALLKSRFREVLGEPERGADCDSQWSLQPFPGASSINVLVSGGHHLAVWLFDPHTPRNCVHRWPIVHHEQVEQAIGCVQERLSAALRSRAGSPVDPSVPLTSAAVSNGTARAADDEMFASVAAQQQHWDRGALSLLHAVQYSGLNGLGARSASSVTARRQRMVRAAADAADAGQAGDSPTTTRNLELL